MRLAVPHRQQLNSGYCLPACVEMVLAYWGIARDQSAIAQQPGTIPGAGTPGSRIFLLISPKLDVTYQARGEVSDLLKALRQSIPPIALVSTGQLPYWNEDTPHAVVVIGMEESHVILNDPARTQPGIGVLSAEFNLAWDGMDNAYALLKKK